MKPEAYKARSPGPAQPKVSNRSPFPPSPALPPQTRKAVSPKPGNGPLQLRLFNFVSPLLNERMQAKIKVGTLSLPFA